MTEEEAIELSPGDEVLIRGTFIRCFNGDMVITVKSYNASGGIYEHLTFAIPEVVSLPTADRKGHAEKQLQQEQENNQ